MPAVCSSFASVLAAAAIAASFGCARAEEIAERSEHASPRRECFSTAQTRAKIEAHRLADPFACMRLAAREHNSEALGATLCRYGEKFIYEIRLLRPDGHIVRLLFDAETGKPHSGLKD